MTEVTNGGDVARLVGEIGEKNRELGNKLVEGGNGNAAAMLLQAHEFVCDFFSTRLNRKAGVAMWEVLQKVRDVMTGGPAEMERMVGILKSQMPDSVGNAVADEVRSMAGSSGGAQTEFVDETSLVGNEGEDQKAILVERVEAVNRITGQMAADMVGQEGADGAGVFLGVHRVINEMGASGVENLTGESLERYMEMVLEVVRSLRAMGYGNTGTVAERLERVDKGKGLLAAKVADRVKWLTSAKRIEFEE